MAYKPISAIILAGGASRRLGIDKRRLRLWGEHGPTLLERTLATANELCDEALVVLNDPELWPPLPARLVRDAYPGAGPLGGVYTGLEACTRPFALVLACDMPFLRRELLAAMLAVPRDYDLLAPRARAPRSTRNDLGLEPLHAVYSRACLPAIRHALEAGERHMTAFFPHVRVRVLEREEYAAYDPDGLALFSLNTPEQLDQARQRIAAISAH
ncbi:MAG: molybdenum cofactor guanylyltransferase [Oscillochloridaceae bacterium]|nr:molybdenum cofactor guanylyltransferase [Chloroflexaceae bacterium]MDW8391493.1 molybdenum cofactor guanylyltransferase [Oscillochloridaceae bacterium]